ncbi:hypothetical protein DL98DRAFT_554688 [Cadophora sp. DSE1049]|nr:hypothetical protein DL98DRAFT_554688 [Cadophora sp. DSE1049]
MTSYHRVLKVFGRSIEDKTLQCDCDIHPWEVKVNGKRWTGRLRLIGFVDLFFLISYSGSSRFHHGIVIYKRKVKYSTTSSTVDYVVNSIGHPIGLKTQYNSSSLAQYTIKLGKPQDGLLKRKYKNAIKQHDTLDMIQDAVKLGLVSYAEILGHGLSHIYRGGSTLDVGKGFVGGLGASKERRWAGLSGDKA